jgi:sulfide:quinone oxidoreductase
MADRTVVVLGGGTGGLVAAQRLRRLLDPADRVVLIDRSATYRYAPSFLWVMSGARRPEQITRDLRTLRRRGIEVVIADAQAIETANRRIQTSSGDVDYDRLVVAVGADLAPQALPGFADAAHNLYTVDGAVGARDALQRLSGGRVVILVSRLPFKCPAAPYEAALLAEAVLRRRGIRDRSSVAVVTPEGLPMPTAGPVIGEALAGMLRDRDIAFHPTTTVERVDAEDRSLVITGGERIGYDVLIGVPPHAAPNVVRTSGLNADGGFVPVDRGTLATNAEGVHAIGDVTAIPIAGGKMLPKAGIFAHAEAEVASRRIAAELRGGHQAALFDGHGSCFVEMGDGVAAYATGDFYAEGAPDIHLRKPGRQWHALKVGFEQYWLRRWWL